MRRLIAKLKSEAMKAELAPFEAVLVGRPNCGKSAIFNRLVKRNDAIVSAIAGTTRDRKEGKARIGELEFTVVDTGGLEDGTGEITKAAQTQTKYAIEEADAVLFCVDAKSGITRDDEFYARYVRKFLNKDKNAILVANKVEGKMPTMPAWDDFINDCLKLGMGYPVPFSAIQGDGLTDLHDALLPVAKRKKQQLMATIAEDQTAALKELEGEDKTIVDAENIGDNAGAEEDGVSDDANPEVRLTILGRPNAGKSTLLNSIVGSERVIVGPTPGLTRDSTEVNWTYDGRPVRLVDTAGWRAKQRSALYDAAKQEHLEALDAALDSKEKRDNALLEGLSVDRAFKALAQTHVAVLVVDIAATGMSGTSQPPAVAHQDLAIAGRVIEEGKPLVIAVNKIDRVLVKESEQKKRMQRKLSPKDEMNEPENVRRMDKADLKELEKWVSEQFAQSIPETAGCPIVLMSALKPNKDTVDELMKTVIDIEARWSSRVKTSKLNRWLVEVVAKNPPPSQTATFSRRTQSHMRHGNVKKLAPIPVKLKYATQVSTRPPTFCVFVNRHRPDTALNESYKRYLINQLKESFNLHGIPIRLMVRSTGNPFADGRKTSSKATGAGADSPNLANVAAKVKTNSLE